MSRLLLITYEFPPKAGPGIQRVHGFARGLGSRGWDVTVLTVEDPPASTFDPDPLDTLPESVTIERAWSLEPTRLVQALRRGRSDVPPASGSALSVAEPAAAPSGGYSGMPRWLIRLVQGVFVPDEKALWMPWARSRAQAAHLSAPFDVILASGPPFTAMRVAWRVSAYTHVPWVADLRDPIFGGYFFKPLTPLHRRAMRRFERRVVESAAAVMVATEGMRDQLVERYPDAADRIVVLHNGFDAEDFERDVVPCPDGFTISYVGRFQATIQPDVFLAGAALAAERDEALATDLRIRLVGPASASVQAAVESSGLAGSVVTTGPLVHEAAVDEMHAADVLLLVLGPEEESRLILTGKLPEYLGARKPVLALVPEGVASGVLDRSGAGVVVDPTDPEAVASAVSALYAQWKSGRLPEPDSAVVAEFDRRQSIERLEGILTGVVNTSREGPHA